MKKLNLFQNYAFFNKAQKITSILLIFVSVMFIANSCTKENELSREDAIQLRTEMTPEQRVAAFTPVVNGTFDPAKTYTGQEAVLGAETVLNYDYGDFSKQFDESHSLKDTFTVAKEGGVITDRVVADIYAKALQLMKCHYASILKTNKVELLADLNLVSENSSQIVVELNNLIGSASIGIGSNIKTFVAGDNWKANLGKCNDPGNPGNAPKEIAKYANFNLVGLAAQAGIWYSSFEDVYYDQEDYANWFKQNPNDPHPGDYIVDYFQWRIDGCNDFAAPPYFDSCKDSDIEIPVKILDPNTDEIVDNPAYLDAFCIDWPEMNYYLANAQYEAKKYEPILQKVFLNIEMDFNTTVNWPEDYYYWWKGTGKYGKKNVDHSRVVKELGPCN